MLVPYELILSDGRWSCLAGMKRLAKVYGTTCIYYIYSFYSNVQKEAIK